MSTLSDHARRDRRQLIDSVARQERIDYWCDVAGTAIGVLLLCGLVYVLACVVGSWA